MNLRLVFISALLLGLCACSSSDKPTADAAAGADASRPDAVVADVPSLADSASAEMEAAAPAADAGLLECFELSLDPEQPLAIDGVFSATSATWRRPEDAEPVCPASALLPETAQAVPFVAFAFCNPDSEAQTFDIELISSDGPNGEPPLDDPYLVVYDGQRIPADPLQCRAINDSIPDAMDTEDAELLGLSVPAGGAITVVATTYTFDPSQDIGTGYYILVVSKSEP